MTRLRRCAAAVGFAMLLAPSAASTADAPLTLRAAVAFALAHSSTLATRRATVAQDDAAFVRLRAMELPAVTGILENQMTRSQNASGNLAQFGLSPASQFSQNTAEVSSTWNVFTGSSAQLQTQAAKRTLEAAKYDLARSEQQTAADVAASYYDLASRHETVLLDESDSVYQNTLLDSARIRERDGKIAEVDVLRAQVSALRSQVVLASARNDESDAAEALAQTIGAAPETSFRSDESIPEPKLPMTPLAAMVATAKEHRYDVLSARKSLEYARLTDSNVDSDLFPQIQINAAFGNQYSPTTLAFSPFTALPTGTRGSPGFWQLGATATLTLPIIDYGTRSAAHKSARALIQADSAILNGAETGAEVAVRSALREVQTSYENLQTSKLAATLGAESTRIAELQYRSGMISLTDAGATEQSALQAGTDLIAARVKYAVAVIRLKVAVGVDSAMSVIEDGPS